MAKRRKLNKRVVILLAAVGVVLLIAGGYFYIKTLPGDTATAERKADELYQAAIIAKDKGDFVKAASNFEEAVKLMSKVVGWDKDNPKPPAKMGRMLALWAQIPGLDFATRDKLYKEAIDSTRMALKRDPKNVEAQKFICDVAMNRAFGRNEWAGYIQELDAMLVIKPDDADALFMRAVAKERLSTAQSSYLSEALADYRKAVELKPAEESFWFGKVYDDPKKPAGLIPFLYRNYPAQVEQAYYDALMKNLQSAEFHVKYAQHLLVLHDNLVIEIASSKATSKPEQTRQLQEWKNAAEKHVQAALGIDPKNISAKIAQVMLSKNADLDGMVKSLEEIAHTLEAAQGGDSRTRDVQRSQQHTVYTMLMSLYERQQDLDRLAGVIRKLLKMIPEDTSDLPKTAEGEALSKARRAGQAKLNFALGKILLQMSTRKDADKNKLVADAKDALGHLRQLAPDSAQQSELAGYIAMYEGRLDEAIDLLEASLAASLSMGDEARVQLDVFNNLMLLYQRRDVPGKAEKTINSLLAIVPGDARLLFMKASLEVRSSKYSDAAKTIARVLETKGDSSILARAMQYKYVLDLMTGRTSRLPAELKLDANDASDLLPHLTGRVQQLWATDKKAEAVVLLEDLRTKYPDEPQFVNILIAFYREMGQPSKADALISQCAKAHAGDPAWEKFLAIAGMKDPEERFKRQLADIDEASKEPFDRALKKAALTRALNRGEDFLKYLQEAASLRPDDKQVVEWQLVVAMNQSPLDVAKVEQYIAVAAKLNLDGASGRVYQAQLAVKRQDFTKAISLLVDVLKEQPYRQAERVLLGDCYQKVNNMADAELAYRQVCDQSPDNIDAIVRMAGLAQMANNSDEFEKWVSRAIVLMPDHPNVVVWQQMIQEGKTKDDQLGPFIAKREALLGSQPNDVDNILRLALLYERSKRYAESEVQYKAYFDKNTNKLVGGQVLGAFYNRRQKYGDVISLFNGILNAEKNPLVKAAAYVAFGNLLEQSSIDQAGKAYDQAIDTAPNEPVVYAAKANYLIRQNKSKEAIDAMVQYVKLRPDDIANRKRLIQVRIGLKTPEQLDQAGQEIQALRASNPEDMDVVMLEAICWANKGKFAEAAKALQPILSADSGDIEARLLLSDLARGRKKQALEELSKARIPDLKAVPNAVVAVLRLGQAWLQYRNYDEARKVFQAVLNQSPESSEARYGLLEALLGLRRWDLFQSSLASAKLATPNDVNLVIFEARMRHERGNAAAEIDAYKHAQAMNSDSPVIVRLYVQALLDAGQPDVALSESASYVTPQTKKGFEVWLPAMRARALVMANRAGEADAMFASTFKDAGLADLQFVIGQIQAAYGPGKMADKLAALASLRPNEAAFVWLQIGGLRDSQKNWPGALAAYETARKAAAGKAGQSEIETRIGGVYKQQNKTAEAENAYRRALELNPDNSSALNNLAYVYADEKTEKADIEKALPLIRRAIELNGNGTVLDTYGWALARLGRIDEARAILEEAVADVADNGTVNYHLGVVYEKLGGVPNGPAGMYPNALEQYSKAEKSLSASKDPLLSKVTEAIARVRAVLDSRRPQ